MESCEKLGMDIVAKGGVGRPVGVRRRVALDHECRSSWNASRRKVGDLQACGSGAVACQSLPGEWLTV